MLSSREAPAADEQPRLRRLMYEGVAPWMDGVGRSLLAAGGLSRHIDETGIRGAVSNPEVLLRLLSESEVYRDLLSALAERGASAQSALRELTTHESRWCADELRPVFEAGRGLDGRVSVDLDPRRAHQSGATLAEAATLSGQLGRSNVLVKIPATFEGLTAMRDCLRQGIGVHATHIYSVRRYREVADVYFEGLEQALARGRRLADIASVAELPVARLDAEVDARLEEAGTASALALRGEAALATGRLMYAEYEARLGGARWRGLRAAGARPQRLLWSTWRPGGPAVPHPRYTGRMVAWGTVLALPETALREVSRRSLLRGDTLSGRARPAAALWDRLERNGISQDAVADKLLEQGVDRLAEVRRALLVTLGEQLALPHGPV